MSRIGIGTDVDCEGAEGTGDGDECPLVRSGSRQNVYMWKPRTGARNVFGSRYMGQGDYFTSKRPWLMHLFYFEKVYES